MNSQSVRPSRAARRRAQPASSARSRGLSLIEVLVAVLVLGFGLLGLAMLQATNLRLTQSSNSRTVATNLASQMLDDIRNNRLIAVDYVGNYAASGAAESCRVDPVATTPVAQVSRFRCAMRQSLGETANGQIAVNTDTGTVSVTVQWGDAQRWNPNNEATRFVLESRL